MTHIRLVLAISVAAAACGGSSAGDDGGDDACTGAACECTPQGQAVTGAALTYDALDLSTAEPVVGCDNQILTSAADVAAAFPGGDAPPGLTTVDFAVDRVVLHLSNPQLEFVVDDGAQLVIGEELLCQGAAPSCVAYTIHGTTRGAVDVASCPYRGPDPCLAP